MNATGLVAAVSNVVAVLSMPHMREVVTNGSVKNDEFDGTLESLETIHATLKRTPHAKIEEMVSRFNHQLTEHFDKVHAQSAQHPLHAFREAQIFTGFLVTVIGKSHLH
jgi:predicted translin family RNA/ssDNA-binding protein